MEGLKSPFSDAAPGRLSRRIGQTLADVAQAAAEAEAFCAAEGADESASLRIGLALDELAANALVHGAVSKTPPDIDVEVWTDASHVHLRVAAQGPCFDPGARREDERPEGASLGGRGLTILFALADTLTYSRWKGRNVTTFSIVKQGETITPDERWLT